MKELTNYLKTSFNKRALFDTGMIVDFLVGDKRANAFFEEHVFTGQFTPVISSQTVSELFMATRNKKEEMALEQWLSGVFDMAEASYSISKDAGIIKRSCGIRASETAIAATAKSLGIPLVTTIPEAYRSSGIKTFKPY
jgi:predicted nucleic acid-binding protein